MPRVKPKAEPWEHPIRSCEPTKWAIDLIGAGDKLYRPFSWAPNYYHEHTQGCAFGSTLGSFYRPLRGLICEKYFVACRT